MDFQRLFKRKEDGPESPIRGNAKEPLPPGDVLICEGQLLDGVTPARLLWASVGGTIKIKADKILGILEGRTRIKAETLYELYPGLFEQSPNPGTVFNIPLQTVVMQLEDQFTSLSPAEAPLEDFATPFGRLAREDESRFNDHGVRPELRQMVAPKPINTLDTGENGSAGVHHDPEPQTSRLDQPDITSTKVVPASETQSGFSEDFAVSADNRKIRNDKTRREGHERLQELYLTDEPLDGAKVAELILLLPRVAGVVIMLANGAALGGGISGGLNEALLSLTPDFVKHLSDFTKAIPGRLEFMTFYGNACQVSLTIGGDLVILARHEGKNIPPGLRERLVATAQALNMIYGFAS
jgi:hypothetical protein